MTQTLGIYRLWPPSDEQYPRLNALHPRNRGLDWLELATYAETGNPREVADWDVFIKEKNSSPLHVAWIDGSPALSGDARSQLGPALGSDFNFAGIHVNGREFWFPQVPLVDTALNTPRSRIRHFPDGVIDAIELPAWNRAVVSELSLFRIRQSAGSWATTRFVDAFNAAGLIGIRFQAFGDVV